MAMLIIDWFRKMWSLVYTPTVIDKNIGVEFWYKGEKIKSVSWVNNELTCFDCYFHHKCIEINAFCTEIKKDEIVEDRVYIKC